MKSSVMKDETKQGFMLLPLLVLVMAQVGTSGDNNILNVATNSIMVGLGATLNEMQIANMIYSMWAGSFMIISGMVGLIIGWKNNFRLGALMCVLGEVTLALSKSITTFTWVGRSLVGLGGSFLIPSVLALVVALYKNEHRAMAFGYIAAASGLSYLTPLIAGIIIDNLGWRAAWWTMAAYFAVVFLGSFIIPTPAPNKDKVKMDFVGSALGAVGLFLSLIGISKISVWGLIKPINPPVTIFGISPNIPMIVVGFSILAFLLYIEKKIEAKNGSALIPQSFIQVKQVRSGLILCAATFLALGGFGIVIIPYLQVVAGYTSVKTGLVMMTMGIPTFIVSLTLPKFLSKLSIKNIMRNALIAVALASVGLALTLKIDGIHPLFFLFVVMFGGFIGVLSSNASNIATAAINARDGQQSGGIQATSRNVGGSLAVAILGMIMLFSLPLSFNSSIKNATNISEEAKIVMTQENIGFVSDAKFIDKVGSSISQDELNIAMDINARARMASTQKALYGMAVMCLLFLPTVKHVPHKLY